MKKDNLSKNLTPVKKCPDDATSQPPHRDKKFQPMGPVEAGLSSLG